MSDFPVSQLFTNHPALVPVLHVDNADHAVPLLESLVGAGITILEVTLRSECALEVIESMVKADTGAVIGAGTVTKVDQIAAVVDAGAMFGVSPALTPDLGDAIIASKLPFLPGICTPSEALFALERGFQELKFFPADLFGGMAFLNHVNPLFPTLRFCPTGGISDLNARDFLALKNVMAVGGAYLAPRDAIAGAQWGGIASRALQSIAALDE